MVFIRSALINDANHPNRYPAYANAHCPGSGRMREMGSVSWPRDRSLYGEPDISAYLYLGYPDLRELPRLRLL